MSSHENGAPSKPKRTTKVKKVVSRKLKTPAKEVKVADHAISGPIVTPKKSLFGDLDFVSIGSHNIDLHCSCKCDEIAEPESEPDDLFILPKAKIAKKMDNIPQTAIKPAKKQVVRQTNGSKSTRKVVHKSRVPKKPSGHTGKRPKCEENDESTELIAFEEIVPASGEKSDSSPSIEKNQDFEEEEESEDKIHFEIHPEGSSALKESSDSLGTPSYMHTDEAAPHVENSYGSADIPKEKPEVKSKRPVQKKRPQQPRVQAIVNPPKLRKMEPPPFKPNMVTIDVGSFRVDFPKMEADFADFEKSFTPDAEKKLLGLVRPKGFSVDLIVNPGPFNIDDEFEKYDIEKMLHQIKGKNMVVE